MLAMSAGPKNFHQLQANLSIFPSIFLPVFAIFSFFFFKCIINEFTLSFMFQKKNSINAGGRFFFFSFSSIFFFPSFFPFAFAILSFFFRFISY